MARQVALLPRDRGVVVPHLATHGDDVVVLVHGLFATAGVLRPLRERIEAETGAHSASFTYEPGPGIRELSTRLEAVVERLPRGARLHLVGHSLGGLVARHFAQHAPASTRERRVAETISLGTPFGGVSQARFFPTAAGRDILPGSDVLVALAQGAARAGVPHLSILSPDDNVISPSENAVFAFGDVARVAGLGHNTMLYDARVQALVVDRVRRFAAPLASASGA